jgi:hypothetical protein
MRTLKVGCRGKDVRSWQQFLLGTQCDANGQCTAATVALAIQTDGIFGKATDKATEAWQKTQGLTEDGIVGKDTWAEAVKDGFDPDAVPILDEGDHDIDPDPVPDIKPVIDGAVDKNSAKWPPRPAWAKPLSSNAARQVIFGKFAYVAAPTPKNPERIKITDNWAKSNIVSVTIPQLSSKPIQMHRLAAPQFVAWFKAIEAKGLSDRILTYSGCWVPRFVRGSKKSLSNHSFGTAVDVCVPWNNRGKVPSLYGHQGCIRELADFCVDFGIFWGGWYSGNSLLDGMHFELFRVLTPDELQAAKIKHGIG